MRGFDQFGFNCSDTCFLIQMFLLISVNRQLYNSQDHHKWNRISFSWTEMSQYE